MSEPIKPALTPEEWSAGSLELPEGFSVAWSAFGVNLKTRKEDGAYLAHTTAIVPVIAILNSVLPDGFTRDDLKILHGAIKRLEAEPEPFNLGREKELRSLAARIEALLPPEGK